MKKKGVYIIIIVVVIALIFLGVNFLFNASKSDSKFGGILKSVGLFSTTGNGGSDDCEDNSECDDEDVCTYDS